MPLASVTANWLAGWGAPATPAGGSATRPRQSRPAPRDVRRVLTSTAYADAVALVRKTTEASVIGAAVAGSGAELLTIRAHARRVRAEAFSTIGTVRFDRILVAQAAASHVSASGVPDTERAARRRFAQTQLFVILDEASPK